MHGVGVLTLKLATHTYSNAKQGWPSVLDLHPCAVPLASRSRCDEEARGRARGGTLEWMDDRIKNGLKHSATCGRTGSYPTKPASALMCIMRACIPY